jgi:hypothetical protein
MQISRMRRKKLSARVERCPNKNAAVSLDAAAAAISIADMLREAMAASAIARIGSE